MSQAYSDPSRANDLHSLPDVEVWDDYVTIIRSRCGEFEVSRRSEEARGFCPSCDRAMCVDSLNTFEPSQSGIQHTDRIGWFWHVCFPGCLPESSTFGPFETEADALSHAQNQE